MCTKTQLSVGFFWSHCKRSYMSFSWFEAFRREGTTRSEISHPHPFHLPPWGIACVGIVDKNTLFHVSMIISHFGGKIIWTNWGLNSLLGASFERYQTQRLFQICFSKGAVFIREVSIIWTYVIILIPEAFEVEAKGTVFSNSLNCTQDKHKILSSLSWNQCQCLLLFPPHLCTIKQKYIYYKPHIEEIIQKKCISKFLVPV